MSTILNKIFIPALWLTNNNKAKSNVTMSQVSALINKEIANSTAGLLKVDGSRSMAGLLDINQNDFINVKNVVPPQLGDSIVIKGNFDLDNYNLDNVKNIRNVETISSVSGKPLQINSNIDLNNYNLQNVQGIAAPSGDKIRLRSDVTSFGSIDLRNYNEIINSKIPESDNGLARYKTVDNLYHSLESIFDKSNIHIDDSNRTVTASSQHAPWADKNHAFDNNQTSQWVISSAEKSGKSWIKVKYNVPYSIYKIELTGRQSPQNTVQYANRWTLEGSNDDITYDYIHNRIQNVINTHSTVFKVSKPYKYFKLSFEGNGQYGLSDVKLFPATLNNIPKVIEAGNLSAGEIPFMFDNVSGNPILASTENLKLNALGQLSSKLGHIALANNLNMNNNSIENVLTPINNSDGVNKMYVDDLVTTTFASFVASKSKVIQANGKIGINVLHDSNNWNNEVSLNSSTHELTINEPGTYRVSFSILGWGFGAITPQIRVERVGNFKLIMVDRMQLPVKSATTTLRNIGIRTFPTKGERYKIFCTTSCTHWSYEQCHITFEKLGNLI